MLSILDIIEDTTVDGPGFRTAIYAAGCPNGCPGCHNPESWDINRGRWMSTDEILQKVLADSFADVTFSGGDPMYQPEGFTELAHAIKRQSRKNICIHLKRYCTIPARQNCWSTSTCWWTANSKKSCVTKTSTSVAAATNG